MDAHSSRAGQNTRAGKSLEGFPSAWTCKLLHTASEAGLESTAGPVRASSDAYHRARLDRLQRVQALGAFAFLGSVTSPGSADTEPKGYHSAGRLDQPSITGQPGRAPDPR